MKNLRESFNSNKNKAMLFASILLSTSGMLAQNLNAQTPNNTKPKMEQVDKNDIQRVSDFMKPLGVSIPNNWITFASDAIQMLDQDGIASAQMILKQDLPKVAEADRPAYVLMAFDAIRKAYDKEDHMEAATEFFAEYITYGDGITSITNRFAQDRQKRSETFIAQTEQETIKKNKESEGWLLKTYQLNPNSEKLKIGAKETKELFDKQGYKYSEQTAKMFIALGIK